MARPIGRRLSLPKKAAFACLTVALLLVGLEGLARAVRKVRDPDANRRAQRQKVQTLRPDPVLHHKWIAAQSTTDAHRSIPYTLTINRQAWVEERDIPDKTPDGAFRIFMVGDSNTQSVVETPAKWTRIVETNLNARSSGGSLRYEVINTGTSSYSPLLYYLQIKTQIMAFSPDLVNINVDMTDVVNDSVYELTMRTDPAGDPIAVTPTAYMLGAGYIMTPQGLVAPSLSQRITDWGFEHSVFMQYLRNAAAPYLKPATMPAPPKSPVVGTSADWLDPQWTSDIQKHVDFTTGVLKRTFDFLKSRGVKVMVTGVPHYPQYTGVWSARPHEALAQTCRVHGVPFLNLYERLKPTIQGTKQADYYWDTDPTHFNAAGNRLWADELTKFLMSEHPELLNRSTVSSRSNR